MAHIYKQINAESPGGGSGDATTYTQLFNASSDWGSPSSGAYSITVTQATHEGNIAPLVQVFEKVGLDYEQVEVDVSVNPSGDVTISVTETNDGRFEGKIVIL